MNQCRLLFEIAEALVLAAIADGAECGESSCSPILRKRTRRVGTAGFLEDENGGSRLRSY